MSQITTQKAVASNIPRGLEASIHQPSEHRTAFSEAAETYWDGDYAAARKLLNPILRDDPKNDPALRLLGKVCDEGNPAPSLRANASRLIDQHDTTNDRALLQKAFTLVHLAQAYDPRQQHDAHHYHLARIADADGDKDKALEHLNEVFEVNAFHTKSLELLANMQMEVEPDTIEEYTATGGTEEPFYPLQDEDYAEIVELRDDRPSPKDSETAKFFDQINAMSI